MKEIRYLGNLVRDCRSSSSYFGMREEVSHKLVGYIQIELENRIHNDIRYTLQKYMILGK